MEPGPEVAILLSGTLRLSAGPPSSSAPSWSCPFAVLAVTLSFHLAELEIY